MADVFIEEYADWNEMVNGSVAEGIPGHLKAKGRKNSVSSSTQYTIQDSQTRYLVISATGPVQFELGSNPTADSGSRNLPAEVLRGIATEGASTIAFINRQ